MSSFCVTVAVMTAIEEYIMISSVSSLSSYQSRRDPFTPTPEMSFKKRIQSLNPMSRLRRKFPRERAASPKQHNTEHISKSAPSCYEAQGQSTVPALSQKPSSERLARDRYHNQQYNYHEAQRPKPKPRKQRDSMFSKKNDTKDLDLCSQGANAAVLGIDGEPVDQRVIDLFFMLVPACESEWRNSARWRNHQAWCLREPRVVSHFFELYQPCFRDEARWREHEAKCLEKKCHICKVSEQSTKKSPSPPKAPSTSAARSVSPKGLTSSKRASWIEDNPFFPFAKWRSSSPKRKAKGKARADEEEARIILAAIFPKAQVETQYGSLEDPERLPKRSEKNILVEDRMRRTQELPIRCSGVKKTLDPSHIPVPAVPDLKPADSSAFDPANLAHMTGRAYDGCPLDEGILPFPLTKNSLPPPTPQLNPELPPERCISPIPQRLLLRSSSPVSSDDGVFSMSPPLSPTLSTSEHGSTSTIRLVQPNTHADAHQPCADDLQAMLNDLSNDVSIPRTKQRTAPALTRRAPLPARVHRRPPLAAAFPPTPPASRPSSGSYSPRSSYSSSYSSSRTADETFIASAAAFVPFPKGRFELPGSSGACVSPKERKESGGLTRRGAMRRG